MPSKRKPPAPPGRRNPIAKALPRLGHRTKPSAKTYTRKGRSTQCDRPFWWGSGDHAGLRGGVGAGIGIALLAGDRGDVDDPAVVPIDHAADQGPVQVEDAHQVDVDDPAELRRVVVRDPDVRPANAGIGDQDVRGAERRFQNRQVQQAGRVRIDESRDEGDE